uniref:Uncharacterized protein n=1 Tax=Anguilla anguilla TaxID=7936 RepID=A0A0E9S7C4_ANGAN
MGVVSLPTLEQLALWLHGVFRPHAVSDGTHVPSSWRKSLLVQISHGSQTS